MRHSGTRSRYAHRRTYWRTLSSAAWPLLKICRSKLLSVKYVRYLLNCRQSLFILFSCVRVTWVREGRKKSERRAPVRHRKASNFFCARGADDAFSNEKIPSSKPISKYTLEECATLHVTISNLKVPWQRCDQCSRFISSYQIHRVIIAANGQYAGHCKSSNHRNEMSSFCTNKIF